MIFICSKFLHNSLRSLAVFLCLLLININTQAQVPVINSFYPTFGPIGTEVSIKGTGFSPIPENNTVFFSGVKAIISTATDSLLIVTVPTGGGFTPLTVTTNSLTTYAAKDFSITFPKGNIGFTEQAFDQYVPVTSGSGRSNSDPYRFKNADIDGDGKPDIVTINSLDTVISILRNQSSKGALSFAAPYNLFIHILANNIAIGDIDGDGRLDIAAVNGYTDDLFLYRNTSENGNISFADSIVIKTSDKPYDISIGDIDQDGRPDIIVANNSVNSISIFRNNGNFSFAPKLDFAAESGPYGITTCDLNEDNKVDIIVTNSKSSTISVFKNLTANGSIILEKKNYTTGGYPVDVVCGDFDMDGKKDIAVTNYFGNSVSLLQNMSTDSTLALSAKKDFYTSSNPQSMGANDLNGDGKPELVFACYEGGVVVLKNMSTDNNIQFASYAHYYTAGSIPDGVDLTDYDGDGKADMAIGNNFSSNELIIFRNKINEPGIKSVTPDSATVGDTLIIKGYNFTNVIAVTIGGIPASSFTIVDSATIIALVADRAILNTIEVATAYATAIFVGFTYTGTFITKVTPNTGYEGDVITIKGYNFSNVDSVLFGGTPADSFIVVNDTLIVALLGNGASGIVSVVTTNNIAMDSNFVFKTPLIITLCPPTANTSIASDLKGIKYKWQLNTDDGFVDIVDDSNYTGSRKEILQIKNAPSSWYGHIYKCLVDRNGVSSNFKLKFENTWTGMNSNAWEDPGNWSCGAVPDENTDVVINNGTTTISANTSIRSLTVNPDATVIVNTGIVLTIIH